MENKHQSYDLAQMQSLPLSAKIIMTEQRIKQWYDAFDGEVYVSVSGGKDSQVLAHIVKNLYPDVPCVFVNTGLEYDSVRLKGMELSDEVLIPEMNFVQVVTKYGYPIISKTVSHIVEIAKNNPDGKVANRYFSNEMNGSKFDCKRYEWLLDAPFRVSDKCCNIMKKKSGAKYQERTGRKIILGTMADESQLRRKNWIKYGCNAFETKHPSSQPLSFWTEEDIWQYIKYYGLEIAEAYKTESRTGCVFCMFGITQDKDRFLRLKELEPKKYDFVMRGGKFDESGMWIPHNGLGYKFVIDWLNEHGGLNIRY